MQENKDIDFIISKYKDDLSKGFSAPELYFERSNTIDSETPFLKVISNSFSVPENYFEHLPNVVANKIQPNPIKSESFYVPENYFNELTVKIQNEIYEKEKNVFEKLQRFVFIPKYSFAIAAILTVIIATSLLLNSENNSTKIETYNSNTLAQLSEQSIRNYLSEDDILEELAKNDNYNTSNTEIEQMVLDNVDESTLTETL